MTETSYALTELQTAVMASLTPLHSWFVNTLRRLLRPCWASFAAWYVTTCFFHHRYFLEPQKKRDDETVDEFAARVQAMIAKHVWCPIHKYVLFLLLIPDTTAVDTAANVMLAAFQVWYAARSALIQ
jgi:hypothetical protein